MSQVANYNNLTVQQKQAYDAQGTARLEKMRNVVSSIQNETVKEQQVEASKANGAGTQTLVLGAGQLFQGVMEMRGAAQIQAAANSAGASITAPGSDPFAAPSNSPISGAITGAATADPATAAADNAAGTPPTGLGTGFNNAPLAGPSGNPSPAAFVASAPPANSGGAAGGGGGPTTTSAATGDNSDQTPKQLVGDSARYDGGTYGSAGGGKGTGGVDKGPDLSGLLAQFLPKKEEEFGNKTLEFAGGRSPASDEPVSLLDRNTNIFERIHEAYQEKNRRGTIGVY
jgi:hypothetical protein